MNGDNVDSPAATMKQCDFTNATGTEEISFFIPLENVNSQEFLGSGKIFGNIKKEKLQLKDGVDIASDLSSVENHQENDLNISQPFLILRNNGSTEKTLTITSPKLFSLPQYTIKATAKRGDASQTFQFSENRSKYFEILTESFTPTSK